MRQRTTKVKHILQTMTEFSIYENYANCEDILCKHKRLANHCEKHVLKNMKHVPLTVEHVARAPLASSCAQMQISFFHDLSSLFNLWLQTSVQNQIKTWSSWMFFNGCCFSKSIAPNLSILVRTFSYVYIYIYIYICMYIYIYFTSTPQPVLVPLKSLWWVRWAKHNTCSIRFENGSNNIVGTR